MGINTSSIVSAAAVGIGTVLVRPSNRGFTPQDPKYRALVAQAVIEEHHTDEVEITQHPIEQNAPITDHAYERPAELVIKFVWSNSPSDAGSLISTAVSAAGIISGNNAAAQAFGIGQAAQAIMSGNAAGQINDLYAQLLQLKSDRVLCKIVTGKRVYTNMLFRMLSVITNMETENCLMVTAHCRQVIITTTQIVAVKNDPAVQANPGKTNPPLSRGTQQPFKPTHQLAPGSPTPFGDVRKGVL